MALKETEHEYCFMQCLFTPFGERLTLFREKIQHKPFDFKKRHHE